MAFLYKKIRIQLGWITFCLLHTCLSTSKIELMDTNVESKIYYKLDQKRFLQPVNKILLTTPFWYQNIEDHVSTDHRQS